MTERRAAYAPEYRRQMVELMEGFRPVFNEAIFPESENGDPEPLLGYVILQQAQAAVDMLGHRLVPMRYIDLK